MGLGCELAGSKEAFRLSCQVQEHLPGRNAAHGILCAARGDEALETVAAESPQLLEQTPKLIQEIPNGTHPDF